MNHLVLSLIQDTKRINIDPYVSVKNNRYVLDDKAKNIITPAEYNTAQKMIAKTNQVISGTQFVIDKDTKTTELEFTIRDSDNSFKVVPSTENPSIQVRSKYHFGVNKVKFHWNYVRIYLDRTMVKNIVNGGGALSVWLGSALPLGGAITAFVVSNIGEKC